MDKVHYNKLVRDNIPSIIAARGSLCETRALDVTEYEEELLKKVTEEAVGVTSAQNRDACIDELADLLIVLEAVRAHFSITEEEMDTALARNKERKGGFTKRLYLLWSSDDGYSTREPKGS